MNEQNIDIPIACNPHALSAEAWIAHQQTSEQVFRHLVEAWNELTHGYTFRLPARAFPLVAAFVDGERCCCPFFNFTINIPPAGGTLTLEITGSLQAKAILAQELGLSLSSE